MPDQVPLCMIGDSITWANHGDCWRQELVRRIPRLAFVGTHAGMQGYGHAGEGGNSTDQVLGRLDSVPGCAHYSLLIGTNDNGVADPALIPQGVARTVANIEAIVGRLLARSATRTVFLGSLLPCHSDGPEFPANPLRDRANQEVNAALRARLGGDALPAGRVAWVEYEHRLRQRADWREVIRLHPLPAGYALLADILAEAVAGHLGLAEPGAPCRPPAGAGVEVVNLVEPSTGRTRAAVVAGWYTLSFTVEEVGPGGGSVAMRSGDDLVGAPVPVAAEAAGRRLSAEVFTGYEGYGYIRSRLSCAAERCSVSRILFEKHRPSGLASGFGTGVYIDRSRPPAPGEPAVRPRP
jgi:hypothetical protein